MNIGARLKQARLNKQMTQDQLGQALGGLTGPTISAIESGTAKTFRDPALILKASKILEVSPIWLQFGIGDAELVNETVPLIDWEDVLKLPVKPSKVRRRIGTTIVLSPKSYALKVTGNSMIAQSGNDVSFREGTIVIIDPEITPKSNSFVIASHNKEILLRKLVQEGNKQFLQPLNQLFQQELVTNKTKFHGVVKGILQEEFD